MANRKMMMICTCMLLISSNLTAQEQNVTAPDQVRLDAVITFAKNVLADGKDFYSKQSTA